MREKQKFFVLILGSVLTLLVIAAFLCSSKKSSTFSLTKIRSPFEPSPKWETEKLPAFEVMEVENILSQDFNYLGSGAQCYAFLSADGNTVLKFFKVKHLVPKKWLKLLPLPGLENYRFQKIEKRILCHEELFMSYKMAFEELRQETGLVYIHLNKTKGVHGRIKLYDRMRNCFVVNLDEYEFVIQKKAQLVQDRIASFMQKGQKEEALEAIFALLRQVVSQCKQGFIDRDSGISHNYGFVGDQVVHFDIGRIVKDERANEPGYYQREVMRVGQKLESWLGIYYPDLVPYLEEAIYSVIDPSSQKKFLSHE